MTMRKGYGWRFMSENLQRDQSTLQYSACFLFCGYSMLRMHFKAFFDWSVSKIFKNMYKRLICVLFSLIRFYLCRNLVHKSARRDMYILIKEMNHQLIGLSSQCMHFLHSSQYLCFFSFQHVSILF